ncbi:MAG: hypothetical protein GY869_07125 [Planctomycetes bacterium]|nr:hypothetical protein [Planctomycetota bacterium]
MTRFIICLFTLRLILTSTLALADPPDWEVNPADYQFTANVTAVLYANDELAAGSDNLVAAFAGSEVRGIASPTQVGETWMFFLTVYANNNGETITFQAYVADMDQTLDADETITFTANSIFGDPLTPFEWHVYYTFDFPPVVSGIPDQIIEQGQSFATFDLDDYLQQQDADPVDWTYSGNSDLSVSIDGNNVATVTPPDGNWIGTESITFTATEVSANSFFDSDEAVFTIEAVDHAPEVGDIPDQSIGAGGSFSAFDLDDYLTEPDGDAVAWSYAFQVTPGGQAAPGWSVNPADYGFSMAVTALVKSRGEAASGDSHYLAAFAGAEVRGVTQAVEFSGNWLYFLTVYANANGEEISFQFYDADAEETLSVNESIFFSANTTNGDPLNPLELQAGWLLIAIDGDNLVTIEVIDPDWTGSETVDFTATDQGTINEFSDFDPATFSIATDYAPVVSGIPDQTIELGQSFQTFDLDNYLLNLSGMRSTGVIAATVS